MKTMEYKPDIKQDLSSIEGVLGGQNEVARILGVDKSQISRWHASYKPDSKNTAKIIGVNFILAKLMTYFKYSESALKWLDGVNAHLNNQRPLELIKQGRYTDVSAAIDQMIAGSYA